MPNWGEHILIANKLVGKIKINKDMDKNLFLFGNVLPDVQAGYLVKGISNIVPRSVDHFDLPKEKSGYENFYDLYKIKLNNPAILGYLTHLMTDYYWNRRFYYGKCLNENGIAIGYYNLEGNLIKKNKSELRKDKQKDFEAFQYYLYENYEMQLPCYNENISINANLIDNININNDDVKKVIDYINYSKEISSKKNQELLIYKKEELEKQIDETAEFIIRIFDEHEICY